VPVIFEEHFEKLPDDFPAYVFKANLASSPISRLHTHKFLEIGFCLDGSGIFMHGDRISSFSKGDVRVLPAGMPHSSKNNRGVQSKWCFIYFDSATLLSPVCDTPEILSTSYMSDSSFPCIFRARKTPKICALLKKVFDSYEKKELYFKTEIKSLLLQALILIGRNRKFYADNKRTKNDGKDFSALERISPALNYISNNCTKRIKVLNLAKLCGVSVETLGRLFRNGLGKSPERYLQNMRIYMAAALLENASESIGIIAAKVGYQTTSCFNRQFKKIMNTSPRKWRKMIMEQLPS
jgi:AraC-like DNA-binding protein